ncbi:unnamed protein product [Allacma fusca]|uniref:Uncharacterized protein n=1 Tax=Allacma fusca TaxID=39272 RepID=A0A8J2K044_9HEXA|nr:unnamed protein product [Allacma fusca]
MYLLKFSPGNLQIKFEILYYFTLELIQSVGLLYVGALFLNFNNILGTRELQDLTDAGFCEREMKIEREED